MPADLTNPFGDSCCDGGACNAPQSTQPCGCDPGAHYVSPSCWQHRPAAIPASDATRREPSAIPGFTTAPPIATIEAYWWLKKVMWESAA